MPHPAQQIAFTEYLDALANSEARIGRINKQIVSFCQTWRLQPVVEALQSLRGISLISAVTVVAELGDLTRFEHPAQLMAYLGLVPSEHSSGDKTKKGGITKTGNTHARRALIESAQAYRLPARKSPTIRKRQEGLSQDVLDIAWNAQLRLCHRYRRLIAKGKNTTLSSLPSPVNWQALSGPLSVSFPWRYRRDRETKYSFGSSSKRRRHRL